MLAAIDAGSNTLRLLVGEVVAGKVVPEFYLRRICRLAGGFSPKEGLSPEAKERTLHALREFADACRISEVQQVRAVGTAAFRQAANGQEFVREILEQTQLSIEVIDGDLEAEYMVAGVLSGLEPVPAQSLIIDIGGGSTEFVLCLHQQVVWSRSLSLGVVRLTEDCPSLSARQMFIEGVLADLLVELEDVCQTADISPLALTLIGTAGTITSLAALDLKMSEYDWRRINNYSLPLSRLHDLYNRMLPMSPAEREGLPGMEKGRGDLIIAGMEIVCKLMTQMKSDSLIVSDFGLLEGLLLSRESVG